MKEEKEDLLQPLVDDYLVTKSEKTFEKLIKQLQPFLSTRARYICSLTQDEFEDTMQKLYIVLLQRLEKYERSRGKFITYLYNSMRGDPTDTLQSMCKKKRGGDGKNKYSLPTSLNQFIGDDYNKELIDTIPDMGSDLLQERIFESDVSLLKKNKKKLYSYLKKNTQGKK